MAFQPVPNTAQVDILYIWNGQLVENRVHFRHSVGIDATALHNLALDLGHFVESGLMGDVSEDVEFLGLELLDLSNDPGITEAYVPSMTVIGGLGTPSVPNNVSLALSLRTGTSGRSNRGRLYLIGIPATAVTDNVISSAYRFTMLTNYAGMIGLGAITADWEWCVVSRYSNGAQRPVGLTRDITSITFADSIIDSQRRRLPGRGR